MLRRSRPPAVVDLAQLRRQLGVTQAQLAREMGVEPEQVRGWERAADLRTAGLRDQVEALGRLAAEPASVEVVAQIGDRSFELRLPEPPAATPEVSAGARRAFRVRAWSDHRIGASFAEDGFVAVGDDARDRYRGARAVGMWTSYWRTFLTTMDAGDIVVFAPRAPWVAIGEITGPYEYASDPTHGTPRHRRPVRWINPDVSRATVDADLLGAINDPGTIREINRPNAARRLDDTARRFAEDALREETSA
jgi:transcriptional regulator with XRE-family HTH domain